MGKIRKGILGGFSGKVGTVVGSFWKGKAVMRSLSGSTKKELTELQKKQNKIFAYVMNVLSAMYYVIKFGFYGVKGKTELNDATSYNLKNALTPDGEFGFDRVKLSNGHYGTNTQINFDYIDEGVGMPKRAVFSPANGKENEYFMGIIYSKEHNECRTCISPTTNSDEINLTDLIPSQCYAWYIFFTVDPTRDETPRTGKEIQIPAKKRSPAFYVGAL